MFKARVLCVRILVRGVGEKHNFTSKYIISSRMVNSFLISGCAGTYEEKHTRAR
jgi:hypothetical protein